MSRGSQQLVAYIALKHPLSIDLDQAEDELSLQRIGELRDHLKQTLPSYMLPRAWSLLPDIPLTRNGKIDRKALLATERHSTYQSQQQKLNSQQFVAPRNAIEEVLASIWLSVLNIEKVSVHDDFFNLGGLSFDAVRCLSLIKEQLNKTLSLGDMWECRTIARLATYMQKSRAGERRLVILGEGESASQYFMIHPGGGQVVGYYPLAERLTGTSLGISASARDIDNGGMKSIAFIAQRYIELIRRQQQRGPYTLIGWSSGSYIAFEIAFQLERLGEGVAGLFIIDAPAPLEHTPVLPMDMLKGFFEDLGLGLSIKLIDGFSLSSLDQKAQFARICDHFNQIQAVPLDREQLYPIFRVFSACVNASRDYDPLLMQVPESARSLVGVKKTHAPITVIRAQQGLVTEFARHPYQQELHWGWCQLSHSQVQGITLPGTHHTLLQAPQVAAVADCISRHSNQV